MDDAVRVRFRESFGDFDADANGVVYRKRPGVLESRRQSLARHEFHGQHRHSSRWPVIGLGLEHLVHGADTGVVERRRRARFGHEPGVRIRFRADLVTNEFERDIAPKREVRRAIHDAHPAFAELGGDLVLTDDAADHLTC
jgi:hypothetical protein